MSEPAPYAYAGLDRVLHEKARLGILTALPVAGSYVASAWLLLVAINLALGGYFDVAVRDVVLSIGALFRTTR